jgi:hypothetical protein
VADYRFEMPADSQEVACNDGQGTGHKDDINGKPKVLIDNEHSISPFGEDFHYNTPVKEP